MKLCLIGDMHLRVRPPRKRTEKDFMSVCLGKLDQVFTIAHDMDCDAILQPGDFFHSPDPSKELLAEVIEMFNCRWTGRPFYTIHGQHDMAYRSDQARRRSALRVLASARVVILVDGGSPYGLWSEGGNRCLFSGAAFGQEPISRSVSGGFSILIAHTMVGDKPLWPGHDLTGPEEYVRKHPGYDLYLLGDYHYGFVEWVGDICITNPGCLLRLTTSERDLAHHPGVVIYDTETRSYEKQYLDVAPVEEAFDLSEDAERDRAELDAFVEKLRESGSVGVNFNENLLAYYEQEKTPKEIRDLIAAAGV